MGKELWKQAIRLYQKEGILPVMEGSTKLARSKCSTYVSPRAWGTAMVWPFLNVLDRESLKKKYGTIFTYSEAETSQIKLPYSSQEHPPEIYHVSGKHEFSQSFLSEIKNAWIPSDFSIILTPDSEIILDTLHSKRYSLEDYLSENPMVLLKLLLQIQKGTHTNKKADKNIDIGCSLLGGPIAVGWTGFSGFIQHLLPRLEAIQQYYKQTNRKPTLIINCDPPDVYRNAIETLAPEYPIYEWNPTKTTRIDRLLVPSVRKIETLRPLWIHKITKDTNRHYKTCAPSAYQWLRSEAISKIPCHKGNDYPKKLYISRSDANKRQVANRDELLDELSKNGFKQVELSSMDFSEQVQLMAGADTVVAPHGAGLANTVFATDITIVELFGRKIKPTFYLLAETAGHNYGYVVGDPVPGVANFRVNPSEVLHALDNMQFNDYRD